MTGKQNRETKIDVARYLTYEQLKAEKNEEKNGWDDAVNVDIQPIAYDAKLKVYDNFVTKNGTSKLELKVYKNMRSIDLDNCRKGGNSNQHMSDEDLKRSREEHIYDVQRKLRDYVFNNDFEYFWTLTFDPKICGKSNDLRFDDMRIWLKKERDKARYRGEEFRYIFIPEYHKSGGKNDGTIHWHGITGGYTPKLIDSGHEYSGTKIFNCSVWKYGFSNVQKVRSKGKVANYIKKYITKDLINSPVRAHKKKYWSSKNLKLPDEYYIKNVIDLSKLEPDFDNEICSIYNLTIHDLKKMKKDEKNL